VHSVTDGTIVVERRENFLHPMQDVIDATHVQKGFLLTSKRRIGQVFCGGRGAHGEARPGLLVLQAARTARGWPASSAAGKGVPMMALTNRRAGVGQSSKVFGVQRRQDRFDPRSQTFVLSGRA
jgi:hypothetical protein